jgi:hypothetical protein
MAALAFPFPKFGKHLIAAALRKSMLHREVQSTQRIGFNGSAWLDKILGRRAAGKVNDQCSSDWHGSPFSGNEFAFCLLQKVVGSYFHVLSVVILESCVTLVTIGLSIFAIAGTYSRCRSSNYSRNGTAQVSENSEKLRKVGRTTRLQ